MCKFTVVFATSVPNEVVGKSLCFFYYSFGFDFSLSIYILLFIFISPNKFKNCELNTKLAEFMKKKLKIKTPKESEMI